MIYEIQYQDGIPHAAIKVEGVVTFAELRELIDNLVSDARWEPGGTVLYDVTEGDTSRLSGAEMRQVGLYIGSLSEQFGHARIAVVAGGTLAFGQGRQVSAWSEGRGSAELSIFYTADEARRWLEDPASLS